MRQPEPWFGVGVEVVGGPLDGEIVIVDQTLTWARSQIEYGWQRQHRYRYNPHRSVFEYVEAPPRRAARTSAPPAPRSPKERT